VIIGIGARWRRPDGIDGGDVPSERCGDGG